MRLQQVMVPSVCFTVGVLFAAWGLQPTGPASADEKTPTSNARSAEALAEAAKAAFQGHAKRSATDPGVDGAVNVELLYQWSRRWLEAELALGKTKDKQVVAYTAHMDRMKALETERQRFVKDGFASKFELAAVSFYRIEAEQWLIEAKGR